MSLHAYPITPPAPGHEITYISRDDYLVTIRGLEEDADRWRVTSAGFVGEILRDGHAFRALTTRGGSTVSALVTAWEDLFIAVYP